MTNLNKMFWICCLKNQKSHKINAFNITIITFSYKEIIILSYKFTEASFDNLEGLAALIPIGYAGNTLHRQTFVCS
ncbi:hypothetical protein, partial [uncultured Psychroserpens sp.]|uniref:hypothetical protein n=1 Tax=uncultured Psychroserpens sp. TaxID=255436 RepID=UPI00260D9F67